MSSLNQREAILVVPFSKPYAPSDFESYQTEFARLVAAARAGHRRAVLLIDLEDDYPQPNALQRKNIGEAWANAPDVGGMIAIVTNSILIRGIITAIEWFMKNSLTRRDTRTFARVSDAIAWVAEQKGIDPLEIQVVFDTARPPRVAQHASPSTRRPARIPRLASPGSRRPAPLASSPGYVPKK